MKVRIFEVGPRDGLQNESETLSVDQKKRLIQLLADAGHQDIEIGAFVNFEKVPAMAGSAEIGEEYAKSAFRSWALVPNSFGFQKFVDSGMKHLAVFTAASETFNQKNINTSIAGSFERFEAFLPEARKRKFKVRGYVSTAFGCPYEGKIKPKAVYQVVERLLKCKISEISIGDTIGIATPNEVKALCKGLLKMVGSRQLALHFHDTRGTAIANILRALDVGVRIFDSSVGGLGGCPYAPGASGNVSTEDVIYLMNGLGMKTGIDISKQVEAAKYIQSVLGRKLPSKVLQASQ